LVQAEAPVLVKYLPVSQSVHELSDEAAGVEEYMPAEQLEQVSTAVAPTAAENLPASQWSQAVLKPDSALYFPVWQLSQAVLTPENALYFPAWHIMQASLLRIALNVPAPHMLHALTVVVPQYPALHEQEAKPKSLSELAQHETHNADPRAALYLPASHSEHDPAGPV
jgi:hypothetical protein